MLEAGLSQLVAAAAGVQALIGSPARLYPVLVPENATFPCATYQVISTVPGYTHSGANPIEKRRVQFDTWSGGASNANYADVKNLQAAIRAVLEGFQGTLPDGTLVAGIFVAHAADLYEQDARAYRTTTDYMVHFYPAT
jgi:hypothetical protein